MRRLVFLFLIVVLIFSVAGCSRVKRIANDINWLVFDGEPSREN